MGVTTFLRAGNEARKSAQRRQFRRDLSSNRHSAPPERVQAKQHSGGPFCKTLYFSRFREQFRLGLVGQFRARVAAWACRIRPSVKSRSLTEFTRRRRCTQQIMRESRCASTRTRKRERKRPPEPRASIDRFVGKFHQLTMRSLSCFPWASIYERAAALRAGWGRNLSEYFNFARAVGSRPARTTGLERRSSPWRAKRLHQSVFPR